MRKASNFRIGVFVLAAVGLFAAGLLVFGARSYLRPKHRFETLIPGEVYGLSVGSPVQLRGVPIGRVTRIDFTWNVYPESKLRDIVVVCEADTRIMPPHRDKSEQEMIDQAVKGGLRALVRTQGITGTSILAVETLDPKLYPPVEIDYVPRHSYIPSGPAQFTRVLESIEKTLANLQRIDAAAISSSVAQASRSINLLAQNVNRIDFAALGSGAASLMARLERTNDKLQTVLDHAGAAPMGETVTDMRQTIQTLNEVLGQLKQYPSGFLLGPPPPPAKSVHPAKERH